MDDEASDDDIFMMKESGKFVVKDLELKGRKLGTALGKRKAGDINPDEEEDLNKLRDRVGNLRSNKQGSTHLKAAL